LSKADRCLAKRWTVSFASENQHPAFADPNPAVGLDTVAFIESHYVAERGLSPEMTVDYLKREFLDAQKLGNKSFNGGLYPPSEAALVSSSLPKPRIFALDIGLSSTKKPSKAGEIIEFIPGGQIKTIVQNQALPDGLAIDTDSNRMFWTCMGAIGKQNGAIYSANLDGSDIQTIIAPGLIHTPKQLTLDPANKLIYFCDREGLAVYRCGYDESHLHKLVDNRACGSGSDVLGWCVGIAISPSLGKLYWTQKGPSKGDQGRIFSVDLPGPMDVDSAAKNVQCLLEGLPEPIDLELDEDSRTLYWTDRGELPHGNSLNKVHLGADGSVSSSGKEILAKHFHEAIGLKLDLARKQIYVTDLGGSIYCYELDGKIKKTLFTDENRAFTGVACL
jgi:sugar lactone lactonase YvrE